MRTILDWLREVLTGPTTNPTPPKSVPSWPFLPLDDPDQKIPPPPFLPLDDPDQKIPPPPFLPLDDDDQPSQPDLIPPGPPQHYIVRPIRPDHEIDAMLDLGTPGNLWRAVAGQDQAKRGLGRIAAAALRRKDRQCGTSIILAGPSSADRAAFARVFTSNVLMLPFVAMDATVLATKNMPIAEILFAIATLLLKWSEDWVARGGDDKDGLGMTLVEIRAKTFYPPPIVVFINNAGKLPKAVQSALFKATDRDDDRMVVTEMGNTVYLASRIVGS